MAAVDGGSLYDRLEVMEIGFCSSINNAHRQSQCNVLTFQSRLNIPVLHAACRVFGGIMLDDRFINLWPLSWGIEISYTRPA